MAKNGRGNTVPPQTVKSVLRLYCEPHYDDPHRWLFSMADICAMLDLDAKTVRKIIRTASVKLVKEHLLQR